MNITLDDLSPVISYVSASNGWKSQQTDSGLSSYFQSTFHSTTTDGDSASVTFNGTACYFYAKVDDQPVQLFLGYSADRIFQTPIFVATGLAADKEHTVILTNLPSQTSPPANATVQWFLDIDYVIITTATTDKVFTNIFDDSHPSFSYDNTWVAQTNVVKPPYYDLTSHLSPASQAIAHFQFNGSSVGLYGGVNFNHGNYSVSLDGGPTQLYNGSHFELVDTLLYLATSLSEGPHSLTITNVISGSNNALDIDYALVNSTIDPTNPNPNLNSTITSDTSLNGDDHHNHAGAIAGGIIGGLSLLGLIGILIWYIFRRKRIVNKIDLTTSSIEYNGEEVKPFPVPVRQNISYSSNHSTNMSTTQLSGISNNMSTTQIPGMSNEMITGVPNGMNTSQVRSNKSNMTSYLNSNSSTNNDDESIIGGNTRQTNERQVELHLNIPPPPLSTTTSYLHSNSNPNSNRQSIQHLTSSRQSYFQTSTSTSSMTDPDSPIQAQVKGALTATVQTTRPVYREGLNVVEHERREMEGMDLPPDYAQVARRS
ncbi:hypothetical protein TREMEDRAFT_58390 [Tremella mesenterica DSM 1558]|uniref:uncharacterized protein n=1 Tax=Tremella mesenterica (strain ATCC 24925 / CBS 8224 / DSM 1558 / NBRC 9311 / NRRL Y-6157 / RJB 2259-6 / UBC 559-6) TaxID=578456 RepID=UPI0003F4A080|nr:uncharacterized protein TREMEDRAFT_58390 [Tremella mesenterica DSM 1558]EIW72230.1 hypothetical protein TREMEDRAFT_58390 [Tremella mesenterica DSM 1558]